MKCIEASLVYIYQTYSARIDLVLKALIKSIAYQYVGEKTNTITRNKFKIG